MRLIIILVVLNAIAFIDKNVLALIAPYVRADLNLSATEFGLLQGMAFVVFYVLVGLPIGWLVDRVSRRAIIFTGVTLWSFAASAAGFASSFAQMFVARMGVGAGEATLTPAAYSMIADAVPRRRIGFALSVYSSGASIGAIIAVLGGGLLMNWALQQNTIDLPLVGAVKPWQFVMLAVGIPGLLFAPAIFLTPEPVRQERIGEDQASLKDLWAFIAARRAFFFYHLAGFSLAQMLICAFGAWMASHFIQHFHWNVAVVGTVLAGAGLASVLGAFLAGWGVDWLTARGHRDATLIWTTGAILIDGALTVAAFTVNDGHMYTVLIVLAHVPCVLLGLGSMAFQMVTPNEFRGRISALYLLVMQIMGYAAGPIIPALITDHIFHDDSMLGVSIALTAAVTAPLAAVFLLKARAPMQRAIDSAQRWRAPS